MSLDKILRFVEFTHKFQQVKRVIYANGEDRNENDAEHSYQLALVGWYLIDVKSLDLDIEKVFKYAIAHDLVEVYAGDTYFHTEDQKLRDSKKKREAEAAEKIGKQFSEMPELVKIIEEYERLESKESKYVYALDKVLPVMNIYLDSGRSWRREGVTLKMIRTKDEKIRVSSVIEELWRELVEVLELEQMELFVKEKTSE